MAGAVNMTYRTKLRSSGNRAYALRMLLAMLLLAFPIASGAEQGSADTRTQPGEIFVCSTIEAGTPLGRSVVFSSAQGTLYCYSDFLQVAGQEQITHRWLLRDREVASFGLTLKPPRWSTYSSLKVPPNGRGPWRVEVLDQNGALYGVARFSIVD